MVRTHARTNAVCTLEPGHKSSLLSLSLQNGLAFALSRYPPPRGQNAAENCLATGGVFQRPETTCEYARKPACRRFVVGESPPNITSASRLVENQGIQASQRDVVNETWHQMDAPSRWLRCPQSGIHFAGMQQIFQANTAKHFCTNTIGDAIDHFATIL